MSHEIEVIYEGPNYFTSLLISPTPQEILNLVHFDALREARLEWFRNKLPEFQVNKDVMTWAMAKAGHLTLRCRIDS